MPKKVLVAGATRYLGQYLVKELKNRGYWVRVLTRKEKQKSLFTSVDDFFIGQISKPAPLKRVTEGIDWVFSTVGITRQKDGLTYMYVDYQVNSNLLKEALKDWKIFSRQKLKIVLSNYN